MKKQIKMEKQNGEEKRTKIGVSLNSSRHFQDVFNWLFELALPIGNYLIHDFAQCKAILLFVREKMKKNRLIHELLFVTYSPLAQRIEERSHAGFIRFTIDTTFETFYHLL